MQTLLKSCEEILGHFLRPYNSSHIQAAYIIMITKKVMLNGESMLFALGVLILEEARTACRSHLMLRWRLWETNTLSRMIAPGRKIIAVVSNCIRVVLMSMSAAGGGASGNRDAV